MRIVKQESEPVVPIKISFFRHRIQHPICRILPIPFDLHTMEQTQLPTDLSLLNVEICFDDIFLVEKTSPQRLARRKATEAVNDLTLNYKPSNNRGFLMNEKGSMILEALEDRVYETQTLQRETQRLREETQTLRKDMIRGREETSTEKKRVRQVEMETQARFDTLFAESQAKFDTLFAEINSLRRDNQDLRNQKIEIQDVSDKFLKIRSRELEKFCKRMDGRCNYDVIIQGNSIAHDAECVLDALVYIRGIRTDFGTYAEVYGASHLFVMEYRQRGVDGGLYDLINDYGNRNLKNVDISYQLQNAFRAFIRHAEQSGYQSPTDSEGTPLHDAWEEVQRLSKWC